MKRFVRENLKLLIFVLAGTLVVGALTGPSQDGLVVIMTCVFTIAMLWKERHETDEER